jgi:hypothetical protein
MDVDTKMTIAAEHVDRPDKIALEETVRNGRDLDLRG